MELGRRAVAGADDRGVYFFCGANETMMDALRANSREFWKNWSILTGVPLPPGTEEKSYFSCSC